jgi:hypothetical protein
VAATGFPSEWENLAADGTLFRANVANYSVVSRFVKDVRTLAAAGELTEIFRSVKELNRHLTLTNKDNANVLAVTLKDGKRSA